MNFPPFIALNYRMDQVVAFDQQSDTCGIPGMFTDQGDRRWQLDIH
jgi:hypothetical protein